MERRSMLAEHRLVRYLLEARHGRGLQGIDADAYQLVGSVLQVDAGKRGQHTLHDRTAQVGAMVITEDKGDRPVVEILTQLNALARVVGKFKAQRQARAEALHEVNLWWRGQDAHPVGGESHGAECRKQGKHAQYGKGMVRRPWWPWRRAAFHG